jgi:fermentation-respiration switch protein FrsA (DUF1100 family)
LDIAQALCTEGHYHLLMIDFRGHGASGGGIVSFGQGEVLDVQAGVEYLEETQEFKGLPIGCYGISMGGSIGLLAAARLQQIRAVVSDSAYADLEKAIGRYQWLAYHIPRIPLGQMVIWGTGLRLGCRLSRLSPVHVMSQIAPRSVLIIHGRQDRGIPPEEAEALFQSAKEPKTIWMVQGAEHVSAFYREGGEYVRRVLDFFEDALHGTAQVPAGF